MRVAAFPKHGKDSASCRIRTYIFLNAMRKKHTWYKYDGTLDCDVLYIQKCTRPGAVKAAKKAHKRGIPVVFDMDDVRKNWASKNYDDVLKYCCAITTDTEARAKVIRTHTKLPVHVVQDCIDYGMTSETDAAPVRWDVFRVGTFGHKSTVQSAVPYLKHTGEASAHICSERVQGAGKLIKWSRDDFLKNLRSFDAVVLAHENDWQGDCKSPNRLIVCMCLGLPTIVSDTPAYRREMEAVGCEHLIATTPQQVGAIMNEIERPEKREEIRDMFREYVFDKHAPEVSMRQLLAVFKGVVK